MIFFVVLGALFGMRGLLSLLVGGAAVALDPSMAALYSNRAACHLKLNDPHACAQDCSKALSLLMPPCEANAAARLKAFCRRGAALAQVQDFESGVLCCVVRGTIVSPPFSTAAIADYVSALKIEPDNDKLKADLQHLTAQHMEAMSSS
eukprot:m.173299 g.173299  ORF g.173299 m.173299 type:complete len:149 (+) comp10406_c0_seq25:991-1437(+)